MAVGMVRHFVPYLDPNTKEPFNVLLNVVGELTDLMLEDCNAPPKAPSPADHPYYHRFDFPHRDVGC